MSLRQYEPYAQYRDSGVAWLGMMPVHWHLLKAKWVFHRTQRPIRPEDGVVTAFRDGQVTLRTNRRVEGFTNALKEIGYQGVRAGDLLVHAMDGFAGAIGISDSDGKCSPVCSVCVPRNRERVAMPYYGYLVRQLAVTEFITSLARGIRERSTEFRFSEFSLLPLAVPPKPEQTQIAKFLDHETAKIDALIEKQQQLITLLQEKRQAVISNAVTKGLNPDAPKRGSGVDWLGEIPAHWRLPPVFARYEAVLGKMLDERRVGGSSPISYLRNADVNWDSINVENLPVFNVLPHERERYTVLPGDILICEGGAGVGQTAMWSGELETCAYQKALHRLRPWRRIDENPRYFYYCMRLIVETGIVLAGGTATIPHLTSEQLRRYRLPRPPKDE